MTESFDFSTTLSDNEMETLRKIRSKIKKDTGAEWSFQQILAELASIGLDNWNKMQMIKYITPNEGMRN